MIVMRVEMMMIKCKETRLEAINKINQRGIGKEHGASKKMCFARKIKSTIILDKKNT